ncbi:MAG TPA: DUF748 domain-containing protein, partial [Aquabacterium sp.]|nr:DUF748 domain-containing protein [Aquabacterium sp.]
MTRPDVSAVPASSTPRWRPWLKPVLGVAAVAAAWTGLVGGWLPGFLRPRIEAAATEALGTPVRVGAVHLQPWTLTATVEQLAIGPESATWFKLRQAQVQLSLESVWRLAPVVRRVQLTAPEVWLERQTADRFNISPVIDRLLAPSPKPKPEGEPVRFAVFNIALTEGAVRYTDRVLHQEHVVDQLQLGVPFLSNLPSDVQVEVQPLLQARIDGSPLKVAGKTLPFQAGHRSEVKLDWQAVDVAHWLRAAQPFLPAELKMVPQQGRLDTNLTVRFEQHPAPAVSSLVITGGLKLAKLGLQMPAAPGLGQLDAGWDQLAVSGLDARPLERQAAVASVVLEGLRLKARPAAVSTPAKGAVAPVTAPASAPATATAAPAPWQWSVGQLRLVASQLDVQTQADAPWPRLDRVVLTAQGLQSAEKAPDARWTLEVADQHGTRLNANGQVQVARQHLVAHLALDHAAVPTWLAPVAGSLKLPLRVAQGELALQAQLDARLQPLPAASGDAGQPMARLSGGVVRLQNLSTQATAPGLRDEIKLGALALEGGEADLSLAPGAAALRRLDLASLTLDQLDARLTRGRQGEWLGMTPAPASNTSTARTKTTAPAASTLPAVTLKRLQCQACRVAVTDQTVQPAAQLALQQTELTVENLSTDLRQTLTVDLKTLAQGKGRVNFQGEVRPQPLQVKGRVGLGGVELAGLQPYIDPHVNIHLEAAKAQADGRVSLADEGRQGLMARYQGRLGLTDVRVQDRVNEADFLSWRSLALEGTDLNWRAGQINADLGRIALREFYGRVIINPNGTLNLASIAKREAGAAPQSLTTPQAAASAPQPAASAAPAVAAASAPPMRMRWQGIQLSKGRVDFTDNFIKPNYSADLTRIEGEISAVASDKPEPATVRVSGAVDDGAPLQISGTLHPLGPRLYTDIQGSAKGIELTRLTPYAARYAGYNIEKGSLSVTVHYKVDGGKLEADNQIFLDQLTFGDKTDSPDATKLPVLFAVALLKNTRGEIDINLPISGSLDDPQFSVGGIIWRVFVNLITKAVTAPFSLLMGGGKDELGFVPFEPGSAVLSEAARQ